MTVVAIEDQQLGSQWYVLLSNDEPKLSWTTDGLGAATDFYCAGPAQTSPISGSDWCVQAYAEASCPAADRTPIEATTTAAQAPNALDPYAARAVAEFAARTSVAAGVPLTVTGSRCPFDASARVDVAGGGRALTIDVGTMLGEPKVLAVTGATGDVALACGRR